MARISRKPRFDKQSIMEFINCPWVFFDDLKPVCVAMANHIEQLKDEIDQIIPKKRREPPFKPGDSVTTNFFEKIPLQHETVTRCYRCRYCESGWMVDTADKKGKIYKGRDSHWFELEK